MKNEHKNMLLGYLAGKGSSKSADGILVELFNAILMLSLSAICAIFGGISLQLYIHMSDERAIGFGVLIFFVSAFIFGYILKRFQRLVYLLIFGTPVIYFLIWLFFLSS